MTIDLAPAMRRALAQTRAGQLDAATRTLRESLHGGAADVDSAPPRARVYAAAQSPLRNADDLLQRLRTASSARPEPAPATTRTPGPNVAPGAIWAERRFDCAAGARTYKLYLPAQAARHPRGLLLMLHGCTQTADDFVLGTAISAVADATGLLVAVPEQGRADNVTACWNWFRPGDQRRGAGEPAILAGLVQELGREFGLSSDQCFAAGMSAGGAMALVLHAAYPELFGAVGSHSGLACGEASDTASALCAMRGQFRRGAVPAARNANAPRLIVIHGTADTTVSVSNAERVMAQHAGNGARSVQHGTQSGRHFERTRIAGDARGTEAELWLIEGTGHAWSGGSPAGSHTDARGPDASQVMVDFFLSGGR